jgi:diguanylate cyclase (GGDEF)-like protein
MSEAIHGPKNRAVGFLARLASEFTTVLNLPDLLSHVMRSLHDELGFESASIALTDDTRAQAFVIRAASGLRESHIGDVVPAGRGLHGVVARTMMPLFIPDLDADPRTFVRDPNMKAGIFAPLIVRGQVIGVLSAHRSRPGAFTEVDLDLLTVVARYLTGAVEVARLYDQLKSVAATDMLTGLANRRGFFDRFNAEIARVERMKEALSIALLDLDLLKGINDKYGHHVGDCALVTLAQTLVHSIRAMDLAARIGGDEFSVLFPGLTAPQAESAVGRIAQAEVHVPDGQGGRIPLAFAWGVAACPSDGGSADTMLAAADSRLYAMKSSRHHGRRRSVEQDAPT